MGKPALGKGMKDLIPRSIGITEDKTSSDRHNTVLELETNIERYLAQGFDVDPLKALIGSDKDRISKGIEVFRENVRKLTSAQTMIRSLEGYGYAAEIESINADIKNTQKADEVLRKVNRLKERTLTERLPEKKGKDTPRTRVLKELKVASENFTRPVENATAQDLNFGTTDVDSLMNDLADLGSAFTSEPSPEDDVARRLMEWEKEGFFIDRIRDIVAEGDRDNKAELDRFQTEVERMRKLRSRLDALEPTGIEDQMTKVRKKTAYTYMATDVEHDIMELETLKKPPEAVPEESSPAPEQEPEPEHEIVAIPESPPKEPDEVKPPMPEHVEEPVTPMPPSLEKKSSGLPVDTILEKAKEAYGEGRLDEALALFEEVLSADPENSKARFMIRRIGQKK